MNRYLKIWITFIGTMLILSGVMLNEKVMIENGGKMPAVNYAGSGGTLSSIHFYKTIYTNLTEDTNSSCLADKYKLGENILYSIGDLVMAFGALIFIIGLFLRENPKKEENGTKRK